MVLLGQRLETAAEGGAVHMTQTVQLDIYFFPQLVDCTKVTNYFCYGEKHHIGT